MEPGDRRSASVGRRHDAKGRSTPVISGRIGKLNRPPEGEAWVWLTRPVMASPAWRALSLNGRKLIDRVLVEHMAHGGAENGNLAVTYENLVDWGIRRNSIAATIAEVVCLHLLEMEPGRASHIAGKGHPNRFRIAWLPTMHGDPPLTAWLGFITLAQAKRIAEDARRHGVDGRANASRAPLTQTIEGSLVHDTGSTVSSTRLWKQ